MARDTFTQPTDDVDDVLAAHINQYAAAVANIERATPFSAYTSITTMTGDLTLDDTSNPIQSLGCNGANRVVNLPALAATNGAFYIVNRTAVGFTITVKNAAGTVLCVIYPLRAAAFFTDGSNNWFMDTNGVSAGVVIAGNGALSVVTTGATRFVGFGASGIDSVGVNVAAVIPFAGIVKNFYVRTRTSQPATGTLVFTVRKSGTDQAITVTVTAGAGANVFSDLTHSFTLAAGDYLDIKVVNNASTDSAQIAGVSIEVDPI